MADPILYLSILLGLGGVYVLISSFNDDDDVDDDDEDDELYVDVDDAESDNILGVEVMSLLESECDAPVIFCPLFMVWKGPKYGCPSTYPTN